MKVDRSIRLHSENRKQIERISKQLGGVSVEDSIFLCLHHFADDLKQKYGDWGRQEVKNRVEELSAGRERNIHIGDCAFKWASELANELPMPGTGRDRVITLAFADHGDELVELYDSDGANPKKDAQKIEEQWGEWKSQRKARQNNPIPDWIKEEAIKPLPDWRDVDGLSVEVDDE